MLPTDWKHYLLLHAAYAVGLFQADSELAR